MRPSLLKDSSCRARTLSNEELSVRVLPKQNDEFTCMECFLVSHRSQLADADAMICTDCMG